MQTFPSFSTLIFGLSVLLAFFGFRNIQKKVDSINWPKIEANASEIIVKKHGGGENPSYWKIYLGLTYVVGGIPYRKIQSTSITGSVKGRFFNKNGKTKEEMIERGRNSYPNGSKFDLYYNPKNPKNSTNKIGLSNNTEIGDKIIIFLLIIGSFIFIFDYLHGLIFDTISYLPYFTFHIILVFLAIYYTMRFRKELKVGHIRQNQSYSTKSISNPYSSSNEMNNTHFCSRCGSTIQSGSKKCRDCGKSIY